MTVYDLNPDVNRTPPDPNNLRRGQVCQHGRKSTANERTQKSLEDQKKSTQMTCDRFGLPSDAQDWEAELPGFSADLWWEDGGNNGLEVPDPNRRTRRILTKILRRVVSGEIKCLVVWNLDRLWRDVAICREMLRILFKYDCLLVDFNGFCNIWTYEGRNSILQNAIASQAVSEAARINSPRGVNENLKAGILAVSPNVLGFRSAGKGSKDVRHLDDEQALVQRIYHLLDMGRSDEAVAKMLMEDGIRPYDGTGGKHPCGHKRAAGNEMIWRAGTIHQIGTDCRYIGRQRHQTKQQKERNEAGTEYPCEVFLRAVERDGQVFKEPVVPYDLWARVQARKRANNRIGHRGVNFRALSSLVRCGVDGEALSAQENKMKDGSKVGFWIMRHSKIGCRCRCCVPNVRESTLTDYLIDVLGPIVDLEIRARSRSEASDPNAQKRTGLQQELESAIRFRNGRLSRMMEDETVDDGFLRDKIHENKTRIERLQRGIAALAVEKPDIVLNTVDVLSELRTAPEDEVRLAVRQCLCWIAVLPVAPEREPKPGYKPGQTDIRYSYAPSIIAKFVFLTSFGTYHTAILFRERNGEKRGYPPFKSRPATPEEAVGGVSDFPQPQCFVAGLTRAWAGRAYDWSPEKFAPGRFGDQCPPMPVAEFEWDGS